MPIQLHACDLTVPVTECVRPADDTCYSKHLVELEQMLEHAMSHVDKYAHVKGGLQFRVPPLVHATLPKGGKTTFLLHLFDRLKCAGYASILVSLCNLVSVMPGETDRQKLVRSIATQFVGGVSSDQLAWLTIDEDILWEHIETTRAGKCVILLIDELHQLSLPLDGHASQMLKELWLDKMGRYFVFTANVPLKTDAPRQKASRTLQCIDLNKYREVVILKPSQLLETIMFL